MRKKPINLASIQTLEDANKILGKIAEHQRTIRKSEIDAAAEIDTVKTRLDQKIQSIIKQIEILDLSLSAFANSHKQDIFKDRKTIDLTFGYMGFRLSTKISVSKQTLKLLNQLKYKDAIIIKQSVNKDVLAQYPADKLAEVKAKKIVEDKFWYELKTETTNE